MVYSAKITEIGSMVKGFLEEKMLILFDDQAPKSLKDMSVCHRCDEKPEGVTVGDHIRFGEKTYIVTAVGDEANHTFYTTGHCTFIFNGADNATLPGQIELSGKGLPELKVGDCIEFIIEN